MISFLFPLHCLASTEMGQNRRVPLTKSWNLGTALVRGTMSGAIRFRHSKVRYICFRVRSRGRESYWSMGMHYFASWSIQSFLKSSCDFISAVNLGELSPESLGNDWVQFFLFMLSVGCWLLQLYREKWLFWGGTKIFEWLGRLYSTYLNCTGIS